MYKSWSVLRIKMKITKSYPNLRKFRQELQTVNTKRESPVKPLLKLYKVQNNTVYASAIVTSTSTPGSIEKDVICLTTSEGDWKSMILLWILI